MNLLLKIGGHRRSTIRGSSAFRKGCTANGQQKDGFSVQVDKCSPWPFIARRVRRLGRWSLTSMEHLCSFGFLNFSSQTLYLQGRLVLALILVQLKKGDSVVASKVGLLRHPGERILQLAHGLGFSVLVNSSGLAAVGWLLWWCTGSSCKLLSPSKFLSSLQLGKLLCFNYPFLGKYRI